jgi:hypothetical protein
MIKICARLVLGHRSFLVLKDPLVTGKSLHDQTLLSSKLQGCRTEA